MARGSSVSDLQTIGYCLLSIAVTLAATIFSATLTGRAFDVFVMSLIGTGLGGAICTWMGWKLRRPVSDLVK